MRAMLILILVLAAAAPAAAQPITSYTLNIYAAGASAPQTSAPIALATLTCNQTAPTVPPGTVANPTRFFFDDPAATGKVCVYADAGAGPLLSLPFGATTYTARLVAVNSAGPSAESAASNPFAHPGMPASAPTGLSLTRP